MSDNGPRRTVQDSGGADDIAEPRGTIKPQSRSERREGSTSGWRMACKQTPSFTRTPRSQAPEATAWLRPADRKGCRDQPQQQAGAGLPMPFAQTFTNRQRHKSARKFEMNEVGKFVERLIAAGCMPKVAAEVVTAAFVAGMQAAPTRDQAAEKRRAWDREYRRQRREKSGGSGGSRVELDAKAALWSEGIGLLRQLGVPEKHARSNVGLWLKTQQPELVLQRIREANRVR